MFRFKSDIIRISILLALFFICAAFVIFLVRFVLQAQFIPLQTAVIMEILLMAAALSALVTGYLLFRTQITEPVERLSTIQHSLIHHNLKDFSIAISELARGNLTVKLEHIPAALPQNITGGYIGALARQYNEVADGITECINDYNSITSMPCKRICYVGADSFLEGEMCGEILGGLLNGEGKVAVLMHSFARASQSIRKKGFTSALTNKYPSIEIVETMEENESHDKTYACVKELLNKYPDLKGIYITEGTTPAMAARALEDSGKKGVIKIVAHDITRETVRYISQGLISATISQNPYMQGYNPLIYLYNYLINKETPATARILTHLEEVNSGNLQKYWDSDSGEILSERARQLLTKPLDNTREERFKIAVILPDKNGFWEPVYRGAQEAAAELQKHSVEAKVVIFGQLNTGETKIKVYKEMIDKLVSEQCRAVAMPLFEKDLIPHINAYAERGITFATLNSEPLSFRGMFSSLHNNTLHLSRASEDMAAATTQLGQAAGKISETMSLINTSVSEQVGQLVETEQQINLLLNYVADVTEKSTRSYDSADKTQNSARKGAEVVDNSNRVMSDTLKSTQMATERMNKLSENALKIQDIVSLINDIAMRTNLIAINASILAARAGKQGREFTVVAGEIINLADKSARNSEEIQTTVNTILANIRETTRMISEGMDDIDKSSQLAQTAHEMLNTIVTASLENKAGISEIVEEINKMKSASESVHSAMAILDRINKKNTGAIAEVTNSIREISNQVSEDSKVAQTLNQIARSQNDLLAQFYFDEDSGP
jgi:methyl-accepting chemotaxis protein